MATLPTADTPPLRMTASGVPVAATLCESTPLDAWWAVEDLWRRLGAVLCAELQKTSDGDVLVLRGFRGQATADLRYPALDLDRYRWRSAGIGGSFVQRLWYQGDDLLCPLTPGRVVEGWPGGQDLACIVRGFLLRLVHRPPGCEVAITGPARATPEAFAAPGKGSPRQAAGTSGRAK